MNNQVSTKKLNSWRNERQVQLINLNKIRISHPEHLKTNIINFNGKLNQLSSYNGKRVPVVLRKTPKGYQLLFGLKQLITAKLLNLTRINAIVVSCKREELVDYINNHYMENSSNVNIDDITISEVFAKTRPTPHKVKYKRRLIKQGIIFPIELNKNNVLIDGYITYLILREMGFTDVPTIYRH